MISSARKENEGDVEIRNYSHADLDHIYHICLKTGNSGKDASTMYNYPELLGDYYAAPYVKLEPELAIIAALNNIPKGYIIGTENTIEFANNCELEWFPTIREKYSGKLNFNENDKKIIELINKGYEIKTELIDYPAHLHIDLLPDLQGKGIGKKLIELFISKLKDKNVRGLHLGVGKRNKGAIEFYKKVGFNIISEYKFSITFGMKF